MEGTLGPLSLTPELVASDVSQQTDKLAKMLKMSVIDILSYKLLL